MSDKNNPKDNKLKPVCCSFCGRPEGEVERLIAGPGVFICNECVALCDDILSQETFLGLSDKELTNREGLKAEDLMTPREIHAALDQYVIGQEEAKKALSVSVYNHYKRIYTGRLDQVEAGQSDPEDEVELSKSNIMLIGPTGSGKTLLAQTLARILEVPFAIADATALTEAGYVGEDVENILLRLIQNADYDIEAAERGIIYIDEIDKITRRSDNPSITRDVSGEGVQQALLKILESTVANVPPQGGRKHPQQEYIQLDTTNILFILGGAFDGLEKIIASRVDEKSIGFGAKIEDDQNHQDQLLANIMPEDLLKFGLIPEFIGRVPVTVSLKALDEDTLVRILQEPRNALIKQYQKLLEYDGAELVFTDEALHAVAQEALKLKTGARGLRTVLESIMLDLMYDLPSRDDVCQVMITPACILGQEPPKLVTKEEVAASVDTEAEPVISDQSERAGQEETA